MFTPIPFTTVEKNAASSPAGRDSTSFKRKLPIASRTALWVEPKNHLAIQPGEEQILSKSCVGPSADRETYVHSTSANRKTNEAAGLSKWFKCSITGITVSKKYVKVNDAPHSARLSSTGEAAWPASSQKCTAKERKEKTSMCVHAYAHGRGSGEGKCHIVMQESGRSKYISYFSITLVT